MRTRIITLTIFFNCESRGSSQCEKPISENLLLYHLTIFFNCESRGSPQCERPISENLLLYHHKRFILFFSIELLAHSQMKFRYKSIKTLPRANLWISFSSWNLDCQMRKNRRHLINSKKEKIMNSPIIIIIIMWKDYKTTPRKITKSTEDNLVI